MKRPFYLRFASYVSNTFNPPIMSAATIFLLTTQSTHDIGEAMKFWAVMVLVSVVPVLFLILWMAHRGRLDDLWVSVRKQRTEIYLVTIACTAVDYLVLQLMHAPRLLLAGVSTALFGLVLLMCVNFIWKISVHTTFVTAFCALLYFFFGTPMLAMGLLMLLTGWSRVVLRQHTAPQVIAGGVVALIIGVTGFKMWGLI